jgi:GR25 family glycosyltransferase involved in LPS biosynthesis
MRNFVITIQNNEKSEAAAERCVTSGKQHGIEIEYYDAFTPKDCHQYIAEEKINDKLFNNSQYSREDNARAAFCSHFSIWQYCADTNQEVTIFEHDAVIVAPIPEFNYNGCISLGKPSYGKFNVPPSLGTNRLISKKYFPGAHAYRLKPNAAKVLVDRARLEAQPTDIFLNIETFPFLEEYYPWPVEVRESFSTIQKTQGCLAKHMYNKDYVIEEV